MESNSSVRATKAFCVGQAKAGTASLVGLLKPYHRAAHEPEREEILEMILLESSGDVDEEKFRAYLIERDQRLSLDYDVAWANQFIISHLLAVFPDAKFVVLLRDPFTWLQSIIGHLLSRDVPADVISFLDWWFKPDRYPHSSQDSKLKNQKVYSIAAFLNAWNQHINICTEVIPSEKRLVLRTHELNKSHWKLGRFLQIPTESINVENGHLNRSIWSGQIDSLVGRDFLNEMVDTICGENMSRYFPEVTDIDQVDRLWNARTD